MNKDIIIFVNAIRPVTFQALKDYEAQSGRRFESIVLVDEKIKESIFQCNGQYKLPEKVEVVTADFNSAASVRSALKPYENRIFAVTSQYENCIQELRQLLPYLPYLPSPTEKSLIWATEKKLMRKMMEAYDLSLVPGYLEVSDAGSTSIERVEAQLSYPLIVKPSGLEGSLLVSHVTNRQELEETLNRTFLLIQGSYDTWVKRQKPSVLVEEFMVGDMYTIDVYMGAQGECYFTPMIASVVGHKIGYEDFFPYKEFLPSGLESDEEEKGKQTARAACVALGLRSTTVHIELMRTSKGWKVIELGPRIGGYRYELLKEAYGINHVVNDIRNRAGEEPDIPAMLQKYVTKLMLYARIEGKLTAVHGIELVKNLPSCAHLLENATIGQEVLFAKNGGDLLVRVVLSNTDKDQLHKDVAATEAAISFDVEPIKAT